MKSSVSQKGSIVHIIVIVVLVIAILGALGYVFWQHFIEHKSTTTAQTTNQTTTADKNQDLTTASGAITALTPIVKAATVTAQPYNPLSSSAVDSDKRVVYSTATYKPSGYDFATYPLTGTGFGTRGSDASVADADYTAVTSYLSAHHFTAQDAQQSETRPSTYLESASYVSSTVVCSTVEYFYSASSQGINIGCADISSYSDSAKAVQPYYQAYFAVNSTSDLSNFLLATPKINDGANGYKNAQLITNDAAAFFYQAPGGDWQFFTLAQNTIDCSKYNTSALRSAFNGTDCYDSTTKSDSTVTAS
jgi:hypothetical protein